MESKWKIVQCKGKPWTSATQQILLEIITVLQEQVTVD